MNLIEPIKYPEGCGKWSLVGPVWCKMDDHLHALCERFESMNSTERDSFSAQAVHPESGWTLLTFGLRMALFALRKKNPQLLKTGLCGFGLAGNPKDPRDIMTASAKLIYIAERLELTPETFVEQGMRYHPWMQQWFNNAAQRNREVDWQIKDWGFREMETELGLGLIANGGQYAPEADLIGLAMRICRIVESDFHYRSSSLQLDQKRNSLFTPTGEVWMIANPNPDAHPEMKKQMLHMRLFELANAEDVCQYMENRKIPANEAGFFVIHDKLVFTLTARSWVSGVANVETNESIRRFEEPIMALVRNFHRFQWRQWQAFESDGCVTLTTRENADNLKRAGQLESDAQLIYEFKAASGEEASTIHYERQGWKPYQPIGESAVCPNQCGSFYYPLGSGDCPVCGHIG